jgi:hypothetical protein
MNFDKYTPFDTTILNKDEVIGLKAASYKKFNSNYTPCNTKKKIQHEDVIENTPVLTNRINNTHFLSLVENKYNKDNDNDEIPELSKSNLKKSNEKNDYITQFYIGSLSAVGLYIFFRYLYVKK